MPDTATFDEFTKPKLLSESKIPKGVSFDQFVKPQPYDRTGEFRQIPSGQPEDGDNALNAASERVRKAQEEAENQRMREGVASGEIPAYKLGERQGIEDLPMLPFTALDAALPHLSDEERQHLAKTDPRLEKLEAASEVAGKVAPLALVPELGLEGGTGRLLGGAFGIQSLSQLPEAARRAGTVSGNPNATGGQKILADADMGLTAGMAGLGTGVALWPGRTSPMQGPRAKGAILQTPEGARPPLPPEVEQTITKAAETLPKAAQAAAKRATDEAPKGGTDAGKNDVEKGEADKTGGSANIAGLPANAGIVGQVDGQVEVDSKASQTTPPPVRVAETDVGKAASEREARAQANKRLGGNLGSAGQGKLFTEPGQEELYQPKPADQQGKGGEVLGFGGKVRAKAAPPDPEPPASTPAEVAAIQTRHTPGLGILRSTLQGIKSLLLPSMKSPEHLKAAEELGSWIGRMHRRAESAANQFRQVSHSFDKLGLDRQGVEPGDNPGIKFMSDMSQGRPITGWMQGAAKTIQRLFDDRLKLLERAGAPLQTVRENYFPGMWTAESRMAFNAAMETIMSKNKNFDVNEATPQQRAEVKALVDKYLKDGTTSDKDALQYLTRRPMKGKESFRKQKVFDDIMDAAEFGLRPISANPIELVKLKLAEMDKSIMANEYFQSLKGKGELKIINPYEEVPEGWVKVNDKYGTIYGPPTVGVNEFVDKRVYEGLVDTAKALGVSHERLMKFPPGPGNRALGLSYQGENRILSKFGTETSVIAHEIGHQLDIKYDLWNRLTGGERGNERKSPAQQELRAIADLTERGKKARNKEEKIAQVMEAYIHAPEEMQKVAPGIFKKFDGFIRNTPKLKPFSDIKPGLALLELTGEKYVGLPIVGYRIVPKAHGDIINNYLSSSLYNNPYFGKAYKAWMATANLLNQAQLGLGSAFHAGFTTDEAMVSSGANVLKDVYGVLRGNRSVSDLGKTVAKSLVSAVRTPIKGDEIMNAWRNPDGTMSPRVAQIVKAVELAGGGFKMESGLTTDQTTKMLRNWYSGQKLTAAARSPVALTELMMKPIMEGLVPRQKAGVFAELAGRIIDQNPAKPLEELTPQFRQAWNRVDSRLGQALYVRLFANNTAKNVVQMLVRAPGWSGGTIAEIGGGFTDAGKFMSEFAKTGKLPENLPDRTAYVISLLAGTAAINAVLTYALTGEKPRGMDYFAFRTGKKDAQGNAERFVLPTYMKDIVAYARHPGETVLNKTHPLISMLNDIFVKNKDYYGVEVHSRDANLPTQAAQDAKYVVKSFEPFWIRGMAREKDEKQGAASMIAPYFGVMPAPRSVTQSPAENLAHDLMIEQTPSAPRTQAQADKSMAKARASHEPYLARTVKKLTAHSAVMVYEKANADERKMLAPMVREKIDHSKSLTDEEKRQFHRRLNEADK